MAGIPLVPICNCSQKVISTSIFQRHPLTHSLTHPPPMPYPSHTHVDPGRALSTQCGDRATYLSSNAYLQIQSPPPAPTRNKTNSDWRPSIGCYHRTDHLASFHCAIWTTPAPRGAVAESIERGPRLLEIRSSVAAQAKLRTYKLTLIS